MKSNFFKNSWKKKQIQLVTNDNVSIQMLSKDKVIINGDFSFFTEERKQIIKSYGGYWSQELKGWIVSFFQYNNLLKKFQSDQPQIIIKEIPQLVFNATKDIVEQTFFPQKYSSLDQMKNIEILPQKLKEALFEFQKEGIRFGVKNYARILIADEMGVGKTIQALSIAYLYKEVWPILIICPSSLRLNWKSEALKWLDIQQKEMQVITKGDQNIYKAAKIFIISYDLCLKYKAEFTKIQFNIAIADEAHYLKSETSQRTEILVPILQNCKHVILLTGTPALSRPKELFNILKILRPKSFTDFKTFGNRYCDPKINKWSGTMDYNGNANIQELNFILQSGIMIRRLKKDVLQQLPSKTRQKVEIQCDRKSNFENEFNFVFTQVIRQTSILSPFVLFHQQLKWFLQEPIICIIIFNQIHFFSKILKQIKSILGNIGDTKNLSSFQALIQSMQNEKQEDQRQSINLAYKLTGMSKLKGIKEFICDFIESEVKFLVFGHHRELLDGIEEELVKKKVGFIRIDGQTLSELRHKYVQQFQNDENTKVALLSITAAGVGLTLTAASIVVFAELQWTPALIQQAEDRVHRIGQKNSVNIYYLYGSETLDDIMYRMIDNKSYVVSNILDGNNQNQFAIQKFQKDDILEVQQNLQYPEKILQQDLKIKVDNVLISDDSDNYDFDEIDKILIQYQSNSKSQLKSDTNQDSCTNNTQLKSESYKDSYTNNTYSQNSVDKIQSLNQYSDKNIPIQFDPNEFNQFKQNENILQNSSILKRKRQFL